MGTDRAVSQGYDVSGENPRVLYQGGNSEVLYRGEELGTDALGLSRRFRPESGWGLP